MATPSLFFLVLLFFCLLAAEEPFVFVPFPQNQTRRIRIPSRNWCCLWTNSTADALTSNIGTHALTRNAPQTEEISKGKIILFLRRSRGRWRRFLPAFSADSSAKRRTTDDRRTTNQKMNKQKTSSRLSTTTTTTTTTFRRRWRLNAASAIWRQSRQIQYRKFWKKKQTERRFLWLFSGGK